MFRVCAPLVARLLLVAACVSEPAFACLVFPVIDVAHRTGLCKDEGALSQHRSADPPC